MRTLAIGIAAAVTLAAVVPANAQGLWIGAPVFGVGIGVGPTPYYGGYRGGPYWGADYGYYGYEPSYAYQSYAYEPEYDYDAYAYVPDDGYVAYSYGPRLRTYAYEFSRQLRLCSTGSLFAQLLLLAGSSRYP